MQNATATDQEQIINHINHLFQAFIAKDLDAIRKGHTHDWKGFQVASRHLVRGIDQYMDAAKDALASFQGTRYELIDLDVEVSGNLGIVFYLARYWHITNGQEQSILLRSADIYRRESEGWNQCGSNICTIAEPS